MIKTPIALPILLLSIRIIKYYTIKARYIAKLIPTYHYSNKLKEKDMKITKARS